MARSLRTQPPRLRAPRRSRAAPRVVVCRPAPGHCHPASKADVEQVLAALGPLYTYGVRRVTLACGLTAAVGAGRGALRFGALRPPGEVLLYAQPPAPWVLPGVLDAASARSLAAAGAVVTVVPGSERTVVAWPGDTLRAFVLGHVLPHELGHHMVQQYTGKRLARVRRTRDHERTADLVAARARAVLVARAARAAAGAPC